MVVSPDEVFANSYADRIIRIADGEIIEDKEINSQAEKGTARDTVKDAQTKTIKKYSLSAKTVMKMSAYSLGSKKIQLVITLILCIVCFSVFGIADTMASWNCDKVVYDAIMSSGNKYLVNWTTDEEEREIGEDFTKLYSRDRTGVSIKERYMPITESTHSYGCYNSHADGYIEIDEAMAKELGVELYAGRYPEKQGEIAISYHIFRSFQAGAYKSDDIYIDGNMLEPTDKENGILGKTITVDYNYVFTVVGIVDSGYDYEKNSHIDPLSKDYESTSYHWWLGYPDGHSMLYLPKGGIEYINTLMQTSNYPYGVPSYGLYPYTFEKSILNELGASRKVMFLSDLATFQKSGTRILWLGDEKESLADDEAIISYLDIAKLLVNMNYISGVSGSLGQSVSLEYVNLVSGKLAVVRGNYNQINYEFFNAYALAEIYKYATQNASLYEADENVAKIVEKYTDGNADLSLAVAYYLSTKGISSEIQTGYLTNPYGKSGLEIIAESDISLLNAYNIAEQFDGAIIRLSDSSELKAKIAGVYIPNEITGAVMNESYGNYSVSENSSALINSVAYQKEKARLEARRLSSSVGLVRITPENKERINNVLFEYLEDDSGRLFTSNKVLQETKYIKNTMELLKKIFYYVSLGIGIFAIITFGNYLINSIMARKKEIGILRAIGATSRDIFHICLFEGMILFAVIFVVASIISGVAGVVINSTVRSQLDISIPISTFGIRQVALIFVVSLAVTLVVSLIGSYVVSKRKPIDVIR